MNVKEEGKPLDVRVLRSRNLKTGKNVSAYKIVDAKDGVGGLLS